MMSIIFDYKDIAARLAKPNEKPRGPIPFPMSAPPRKWLEEQSRIIECQPLSPSSLLPLARLILKD